MNKKIKQLTYIALLFNICLLNSCNKANKFKPSLDKNASLNLNVIGFFGNFEAFDKITNDFNNYYPNITFSYQQVNGTNLLSYLETNLDTDLFMTSEELAEKNKDQLLEYTLDLSTQNINLNDLSNEMLSRNYIDNKLYSIPIGQIVYGIITNETLLNSFNLDIPTTYDEFKNACKILKQNDYTPIQGPENLVYSELTKNMLINIIENNKEIFSKSKQDLPKARQKLAKIFDILDELLENGYLDNEVNKTYPYDNYNQSILKFFEGNVPFWVCDSEKVSGMKKRESQSNFFKNNPFNYTYIYAPLGKNGVYTYQKPWFGFAVNKKSSKKEYATEFMRFLVTKNEIDKIADTKGIPSISKSGGNKTIYKNIFKPKAIEAKTEVNTIVTSTNLEGWAYVLKQYVNKIITRDEAINSFITYYQEDHE